MRALIGYIIFVSALAFGAVEFYLPPTDREAVVGALSRTFNPPAAEEPRARTKRSAFRVFSPPSLLFETAVNDVMAAPPPRAPSRQDDSVLAAERAPPAVGRWSTVVTMEQPSNRKSLEPVDGGDQGALALALQKELRRVGCYGGQLHGSWGAGSKGAMGEFVKRVNAALPYDRPDYALLTLVRGYSGLVCGADCPRGQVLARDGRCLPSTVFARAPESRDGTQTAEALVAPAPRLASPPLPGRMAIGGPPPDRHGDDSDPANARPGLATGYLDPTAATTHLEPDEALASPPLPRASFPAPRRPRAERVRPARTASRGYERRASGVNSRLPHNQRYIPPPPSMGYRR